MVRFPQTRLKLRDGILWTMETDGHGCRSSCILLQNSAQSKLIGQVIRHMITGCELQEYGLYKVQNYKEMGDGNSHCLRDVHAAMAAFFSACFLFLACSPVKVIPASSTIPVKMGWCPSPDLKVVYWGNGAPTLCAISCKRFL